jgi:tyrosine-protein phosphatase YwqE
MFNFFKKRAKLERFPFHLLKTDIHSHLLPGIDDGSPDEETSIALMKGLIELGYENFVATPHVMEDIWRNTPESIRGAQERLNNKLLEEGIHKHVGAAAEYLVDGQFEDLLKEKQPLLTIHKNWVLIEISFIQPPYQLRDVIFEMQMQGYQPVFAHPERYSYYHGKRDELMEIKHAGCYFQANLNSFSGYYGPSVMQAAEWLANQGVIDLFGTDLHHERHLEALQHLKFTKPLQVAVDSMVVVE